MKQELGNEEHYPEPLEWQLPVRRQPDLSGREQFPINPERRSASAAALHSLRQGHADRSGERSFPWRAALLPATGLPATLRIWTGDLDGFDDNDVDAAARRLLLDDCYGRSLFGETLADDFDDRFRTAEVFWAPSAFDPPYVRPTRHICWQQIHHGLPVLGGSVRVHEVMGDPRVCITSSFIPVEDAPPNPEAGRNSMECEWTALLSMLGAVGISDIDKGTVVALLITRFAREGRQQESSRFIEFLEPFLCAWSLPDELTLSDKQRDYVCAALVQWHEDSGSAERATELVCYLDNALRARIPRSSGAKTVPIQEGELAILPFGGAYHLIRRVEVSLLSNDPWIVEIDAHTGDVLGPPRQDVYHAPVFFQTSGEALQGEALGDADGLDTNQLAGFASVFESPGVVTLGASLPTNLSLEAATVISHGQRLLRHLQIHCNVLHSPPASKLIVTVNSSSYPTSFSPAQNSPALRFQQDSGALSEDSRRLTHPGRDPEVVMHEFAHAYLYFVNKDPWDFQSSVLTPFSHALQEGYAMYLSRSLADQEGDNGDQHWGRGAYRPKLANNQLLWGDRWLFGRPDKVVGADLLPAPNTYPSGEFTADRTMLDYDVGMVWARALWDVRTILGPLATDRLAVQAYPYLHGFLASFELAAEALINAGLQAHALEISDGTQPLWAARGIAAGQGVYGFAQAQAGLRIAASEAGILVSTDDGATWALESANLAGGDTLTGVVAVAADGNHFYALAVLPPPQTVGANPQWKPGVYWRSPSAGSVEWTEVVGWVDSVTPLCLLRVGDGRLLVGSNRGVYVLNRDAANNHAWMPPTDTSFPALGLAHVTAQGIDFIQAISPSRLHNNILTNQGALSDTWTQSDKLFDKENKTRITALVGLGSEVVVGILPPSSQFGSVVLSGKTLRQLSQNWTVETVLGNLTPAVLALAVDAGAIWVATSGDVLRWQNSGFTSFGLPTTGAQVMSLTATATHLLAGTLAHGIWRRPLVGGSWQSVYSPTQSDSLLVPASGVALLSVLLDADVPAFSFSAPSGSIAVDSVYQVGFPPTLVPPNLGTYDLKTGAVVLVLRNLTNTAQALQANRVAPNQMLLV